MWEQGDKSKRKPVTDVEANLKTNDDFIDGSIQ
jgi:hypothetical protein